MAFRRVNAGRLSKCLAQGFTASQHCTMHPTSPHKLHTAHCTLNTAHWTMHIPTLHTAHWRPQTAPNSPTLHTAPNFSCPFCDCWLEHCVLITEWALSCWCDPLFLFAIHTLNCVIFSVYPLFEQWCSVCVQSVNMSTFCGQTRERRRGTDAWIWQRSKFHVFFLQIYVKEVACVTCDQFFCELMLMLMHRNMLFWQKTTFIFKTLQKG